jgi:hypothetical protein
MLKLLGVVIVFCLLLILFGKNLEGFTTINHGDYPKSEEYPILSPGYTYTGNKQLSDVTYADIWQDYPAYPVGSYAQMTNNLKYWKSPDNGLCVRANFCDTLYKDKEVPSNIISALGPAPVPNKGQVRVNYYVSE